MNEHIKHIICQYLSGETSADEEKILFDWITLSQENERTFFESAAIWRMKFGTKDNDANALNHSLGKLNSTIDRHEKKTRSRLLRLTLAWSSVAAVFIGVVFFFARTPATTSSSPLITYTNTMADSIMTITLEDHTVVWLNANSSLKVASGFLQDERRVDLSGCAFFEVARDSLHPFVVSSDKFQVRVLGTSFGISTHYSENKGETILLEGAVQIETTTGEKLAPLFPGQQALISKNAETIEINTIDARKRSLWRFGVISLQDVSIDEILSHLEEIYQIKIRMEGSNLFENNRYNFSYLKNKNPEDVLEYLYFLTGKKAKIVR